MPAPSRHQGHDKYKTRIESLIKLYDLQTKNLDINIEVHSHNAKYLAVLVSGYLEQAVKEILLGYATQVSRPQITRYLAKTWPISKNMYVDTIKEILNQFSEGWAEELNTWLNEDERRKADINLIISWRNSISHGQESNTTGVTLVSVKEKFKTVKSLVGFLEVTIIK
jgi:hypothetical protein